MSKMRANMSNFCSASCTCELTVEHYTFSSNMRENGAAGPMVPPPTACLMPASGQSRHAEIVRVARIRNSVNYFKIATCERCILKWYWRIIIIINSVMTPQQRLPDEVSTVLWC